MALIATALLTFSISLAQAQPITPKSVKAGTSPALTVNSSGFFDLAKVSASQVSVNPGTGVSNIRMSNATPQSATVTTDGKNILFLRGVNSSANGTPGALKFEARVRVTTGNLKSLALSDVYGRLVRLLNTLARDTDGKQVVRERLTQQEIADRIGASRDMIGKLMKDLVAGGYLAVEDRTITILKKLPTGW